MIDLLKIDEFVPKINVTEISRAATIISGINAGRMRSGEHFHDVIGTYYEYAYVVTPDTTDLDDYYRLHDLVTSPDLKHSVMVPFAQGYSKFEAYINAADDQLIYGRGAMPVWDDMTFVIVANDPARYPDEVWVPANTAEGGCLIIDGHSFDVVVSEFRRTARVLEHDSGRNMYGQTIRYPLGTYHDYELVIDRLGDSAQYDDLYYLLTAPVESHVVELWSNGQKIELQVHVSNVIDKLVGVSEKTWLWGDMKVLFEAVELNREAETWSI